MKKFLAFLSAICLGVSAMAQGQIETNTTTTVPQFLGDTYQFLVGQGITNLTVTTYGTYTPAIQKWGGGLVLTRNIPLGGGLFTGVGMGIDYYDKHFYAINGQVSLQARLKPFSSWGTFGDKIILTPFTYIGVGTPFGQQADQANNLEAIAAGGAALHLAKVLGGDFSVSGIYGTRSGLGDASGTFYGAGLNLGWKF